MKGISGVVAAGKATVVLDKLRSLKSILPEAILTLSEFCCAQENCLYEVMDFLLQTLSQDRNTENERSINAAILGVKNVAGI